MNFDSNVEILTNMRIIFLLDDLNQVILNIVRIIFNEAWSFDTVSEKAGWSGYVLAPRRQLTSKPA